MCIELPHGFQKFYFVINLPSLRMSFCVIDTPVYSCTCSIVDDCGFDVRLFSVFKAIYSLLNEC